MVAAPPIPPSHVPSPLTDGSASAHCALYYVHQKHCALYYVHKKTLCILLSAPKTLCTLLCAVHQKHCAFYYVHQAIICALYYVHQKHCAFYYVHQAIMCALYCVHQTNLYIAHNTGFTHILHIVSVHCALQCGPSTCALGTLWHLYDTSSKLLQMSIIVFAEQHHTSVVAEKHRVYILDKRHTIAVPE